MAPPEEARERGSWLRFSMLLVVLDDESPILMLSSRLASITEEDTEAVVDPLLFPSSS